MCNCRPKNTGRVGGGCSNPANTNHWFCFRPPTPSPYGHTSILERIVKVLSTGGGVQHPPPPSRHKTIGLASAGGGGCCPPPPPSRQNFGKLCPQIAVCFHT